MVRDSSALAFALLLASLAAVPAQAEGVRLVGAPGAPSYSGIQEAVDAASDGQLVLIAAGTYAPFTVVGKSLTVAAMPGAPVLVEGTIEVRDLGPLDSVVLAGLSATGAVGHPSAGPGLRLVANLGHVRLERCAFTGGEGERGFERCYDPARGGNGAELSDSVRVAFVDCVLRGGLGTWENDTGFYECSGGGGGDALSASGSAVALHDCDLRGGNGGQNGTSGGDGGAGARLVSFGLFAAGSRIRGGDGGFAWDFIVAYPGDGGDGLVLEGAQAQLLDVALQGGAAGSSWIPPEEPGQPGVPLSGDGAASVLPGDARSFRADAVASDGRLLELSVEGQPGDRVYLLRSSEPSFALSGDATGFWLVQRSGLLAAEPLGVVPASGALEVGVRLDRLPAGAVLERSYLQGMVVDAVGAAFLGSPLHLATLERDAGPDCNGNAVSDLVDLIEGTSFDCQADLLPDECQIAAGLSADCNANGVPDECDIADGTSNDSNGNGVPDECEGAGATWHVDAAAAPGGDGSAQSPFRTIGEGIGAALSGDTVLVAGGLYEGAGNRDLSFSGRDIVLVGRDGAAQCVIDCGGVAPAFRLQDGESAAARIESFTIRAGSNNEGGGLRIWHSDPTLADLVVEGCTAVTSGGGMYLFGSKSNVSGCTFVGNEVTTSNNGGGGIAVAHGSPRIWLCTFQGNVSGNVGGAIYYAPTEGAGPHVIGHCRILENAASTYGGGVYTSGFASDTFVLDHCLIAGNTAQHGGGIAGNGSLFLTSSTVVSNHATVRGGGVQRHFNGQAFLANGVIWGNAAPDGPALAVLSNGSSMIVRYCDVEGGAGQVSVDPGATLDWQAGNLDLDPLFVDPAGPDGDPATHGDNDYGLGPGSPCIDAGDNPRIAPDFFDLDGDGNTGEPVPVDLAGAPRRMDDPAVPDTGNGTPPLVDMGVLERQP